MTYRFGVAPPYTMSHHIDLPYELILHEIYDLLSAELQGRVAIYCHNPKIIAYFCVFSNDGVRHV